jgi:DNA-binding response OmpR family regulator
MSAPSGFASTTLLGLARRWPAVGPLRSIGVSGTALAAVALSYPAWPTKVSDPARSTDDGPRSLTPVDRRIVVIEDDPSIGEAVRSALEQQGYEVDWVETAKAAAETVDQTEPALVLLDLGLPDVDGFTLCRWLRDAYERLPIIIVTARDTEIDIVVGLDAGASDYVTKPFSMTVLLARVRAHLRSSGDTDTDQPMEVGRLRVAPASYRATVDGEVVDLRPREFELLVHLLRNAGKVVTREQLLSEVWDLHWHTKTKTVDMHVLALRRKLAGAVDIATVRGVGYRLERA